MSESSVNNQGLFKGLCKEVNYDLRCCAKCAKTDNLRTCGGCKLLNFCSVDCQKAYWSVHKKECKLLEKSIKNKMTPSFNEGLDSLIGNSYLELQETHLQMTIMMKEIGLFKEDSIGMVLVEFDGKSYKKNYLTSGVTTNIGKTLNVNWKTHFLLKYVDLRIGDDCGIYAVSLPIQ